MLRSPKQLPVATPGPTPADELFALTASATDDGWTARFSATDTMLVGRFAAPVGNGVWPSAAIDALEDGSVLLVAGSPRQQAAHAAIKPDRPLLLEVLDMMDLPDELKQAMDGYAIVAVHADGAPHAPDEAVSIVAVLPSQISSQPLPLRNAGPCPSAPAMTCGRTPLSAQEGRALSPIKAAAPGLIRDDLRAARARWRGASAALCNLPDSTPPHPRGCGRRIRFGRVIHPCGAWSPRVGDPLEDEEGKDQAPLFRLVVHPHDLGQLLQRIPSRRQPWPPPTHRARPVRRPPGRPNPSTPRTPLPPCGGWTRLNRE